MRYGQGGGLTPGQRAARERIRLQAAGMFEQGATNAQVAEHFGVTVMTAWRWRQAWQDGGRRALLSHGPGGHRCRLDDAEQRLLEQLLEAGPPAHGYGDQDWTLARIAEVIDQWFGVSYTPQGVAVLLHRMGWSVQVPARRAAERDDAEVARWVEQEWPRIKGRRRTWAPGWSSRTRPVRG